ncbi:hypothetical protein DFA_09547 [Cavenderia fasciculata]|uniref:EGF-like domain-containing protein n=1 Tax=Cavenderia fasciculata TaxID=261658 RepID=F4Q7X8_CACFS|nr:uncharacterized protein DFA_09547 [Cavenderia fasciculata]EGG15878.1 hypothetical protein DFA_09547 [Cavenderia fasciculata]|eukprot:XP_004352203.1 hypothetical protein DFA_09547 [Cavenderia fasciculata]
MPVAELNSAKWIIRQYGSQLAEDQTSICSSTLFTCSTGSVPHITKINFNVYPSTSTGLSPAGLGLSALEFPQLTSLYIVAILVKTPSFNLLSFLSNMPLLTKIEIYQDTSITSIPTTFPIEAGLSALNYLMIAGSTIQPPATFDFGNTIERLDIAFTGAVINDLTPPHPNLRSLTLSMRLMSSLLLEFTSSSFPMLNQLILYPTSTSTESLTVDISVMSLNKVVFSGSSQTTARFIDTSYITDLTVLGYSNNITPLLSGFKNLTNLVTNSSPLTTFPLLVYPETLQTLTSANSDYTVFPNIPIYNVRKLELPGNNFQGEIPWTAFNNANNIDLDISNNPGLTTAIPESFCNNRIHITECPGITVVPECFLCYQRHTHMMVYTIEGYGIIRGERIGYGNFGSDFGLYPMIPNKQLGYITNGPPVEGPAKNVSIQLDSFYPEYTFNFTVLEVGIAVVPGTVEFRQLPSKVVQISIMVTFINTFIPHSVKVNNTIDCIIVGQLMSGQLLTCNVTAYEMSLNQIWQLKIFNSNFNINTSFNLTSFYPSNVLLTSIALLHNYTQVGSIYEFSGFFGNSSLDQVAVYFNGDQSICSPAHYTSSVLRCIIKKNWYYDFGLTNITVSVEGFLSDPIMVNLTTPQNLCFFDGGCSSGNGACDINGTCICNTGYYSDKCSQKYPIFKSGEYDINDRKLISIYGDFGPFNQTIVSITLNNTDCQVTSKSQTLINCTLVSEPTDGLALVRLTVDNSTNNGNNWIYFKPSSQSSGSGSDSNDVTCPFNCYGHGQCINGKCNCDTGYSSIDNCLTKTSNHTNTPNTTSPTTSFDIDGIDFQFEMIAIQEIDTDDNIINEVLTNSWNSTLTLDNQTQTTTVNYQLNNSDTTALVTATISFSQQPRDIQFGSQLLHIDANSIKLSVNISNWTFNTFLTTLRVIFKTTINNDQSIEFDCQDINIDTLSYDQLSNSIQYLRVVKDNIQFTGRFIDYVLSDGRPTFSKTSIVNKTASLDDQSTLLIGISMPQSSESIIDPDFTPLLVDKNADSGCDNKSNTWRIIVGVVVGFSCLAAVAVASINQTRIQVLVIWFGISNSDEVFLGKHSKIGITNLHIERICVRSSVQDMESDLG